MTLKKEDGSTVEVPFAKLSAECQALAKSLAEFGPRTWSDVSKKHHIEATFNGINGEKVALKKADGATTEVPLEKLSPEDRELAKSLQDKRIALDKKLAASAAKSEKDSDPFATGAKTEPLTVQQITHKVENGVVSISTRNSLGASAGLGSGFLIDASGLVATNYHVIKEASSATVRFRSGTEVEVAGYRAIDRKHDLAIVQLKSVPKTAAVLKIAADGPKQGDSITAIGHPGGFEFTVASGIVSAIRKTSEMPDDVKEFLKTRADCKWIQITAPSAPGSSGGPLLNSQGEVVGIVSWIVPRLSIGFAVHAQHLGELKSRVMAKARPLPVPGSFQGPGVSEPSVLAELASFRQDMQSMLSRAASVEDERKSEEILKTENPVPAYVAKFRLLAEKKPKSRQELESLITIVRIADDDSPESKAALKWAFPRILENYADSEQLGSLLLELCRSESPEAQTFIRGAIAKSPDKTVKGFGDFALGVSLLANPRTRGRSESEAIAAMEKAVKECGSLEFGDESFREMVEPLLARIKSYSVGRMAADIVGKDSKGQPLRLSDYRGKVVVLDFWADWCPYCRQMYAQARFDGEIRRPAVYNSGRQLRRVAALAKNRRIQTGAVAVDGRRKGRPHRPPMACGRLSNALFDRPRRHDTTQGPSRRCLERRRRIHAQGNRTGRKVRPDRSQFRLDLSRRGATSRARLEWSRFWRFPMEVGARHIRLRAAGRRDYGTDAR